MLPGWSGHAGAGGTYSVNYVVYLIRTKIKLPLEVVCDLPPSLRSYGGTGRAQVERQRNPGHGVTRENGIGNCFLRQGCRKLLNASFKGVNYVVYLIRTKNKMPKLTGGHHVFHVENRVVMKTC